MLEWGFDGPLYARAMFKHLLECGYSLNKNKTEMNILKRKGMETVCVDHCTHVFTRIV